MQKVLKWLTPVIALGVAIFLIFFFISINSQDVLDEIEPLEQKHQATDFQVTKTWLHHFSESERKGYVYPVNEVYIKLDLDEKITKTIIYRLVAILKDPYELFCLKQELRQHKLKYYLKKDGKGMDLLIYSQDIDKLNRLTEVLKKYKIQARIELYKEEY
ncbi:MAG: hypothetical protein FAF05_04325 [Epsilonproteobacteria bacterium]|nr:hypothetical protein [Campylobacterota bacterium]